MTYDEVFNKAEEIFEKEYDVEGSGYIHKESFRWGFERGYQEFCNEYSKLLKLIEEYNTLNHIPIPLEYGTLEDIERLENAFTRQDEIIEEIKTFIDNYYEKRN